MSKQSPDCLSVGQCQGFPSRSEQGKAFRPTQFILISSTRDEEINPHLITQLFGINKEYCSTVGLLQIPGKPQKFMKSQDDLWLMFDNQVGEVVGEIIEFAWSPSVMLKNI